MEVHGDLMLKGWVKTAWTMGYIRHFGGSLKNNLLYIGWVVLKSREPVDERDVGGKLEKDILTHAGMRLIGKHLKLFFLWSNIRGAGPELRCGYSLKVFHQEVELIHNLEPADAKKFKNEPMQSATFGWVASCLSSLRSLGPFL